MKGNLPAGWQMALGSDLFGFITSGSRGWADYYSDDGAKFIRVQNVKRGHIDLKLDDVQHVRPPVDAEGARTRLQYADVVVTITADLGRVGLVPTDIGEAYVNQHVALARPLEASMAPYLAWFITGQDAQEQLGLLDRGATRAGLGLKDIGRLRVPVPPLREQSRIVAKIDSLSSKSKRAREQLDHVPTLAENYKQAVLTAAFSNATFTPKRLGDIVDEGPTNGYSPRASTDGLGTLSLKLTATTRGVFDLSEKAVKRIGETIEQGSRYWLEPGDLLIQRSNSLEYVGSSAIYEGPRQTYIYPDLMMRVRIQNPDMRRFVWRFLNSREARAYFRANATGTAGNMPKINGATVRELLVPLPEPLQIAAINKAIETAFSWIDRLAADASSAHKLVDRLDEAILAKAFRGALVPQDPNDEPADVLLERLRAKRAATGEKAKRKKRRSVVSS